MVRIQNKIHNALSTLQFFTTNEWRFISNNMAQLRTKMHPADKEQFNFDITALNWDEYVKTYVLGAREFILKEDPKTLVSARRHIRRMYWVHNLSRFLLAVLGYWVLRTERVATLVHFVFTKVTNFIMSFL